MRPKKHVATLNSLHLVSTSTFCHNRFFLVLSMFLVATLEVCHDLFVTLLTLCLCLSYIHLVATPMISMATFYPHQYRIFSHDRKTGSRPQLIFLAFLLVATCIALVAIIFLAPASISGRDHKMMSLPYGCSFSDRFLSQLLKCSCDLNDWSRPRVEFSN